MSCKYYGYNGMHGELIPTNGNQCGLIVMSHSPCLMEVNGETPDDTTCHLVQLRDRGMSLEPSPAQQSPWHRRIVASVAIPGTNRGLYLELECGHMVQTFGRLELLGEDQMVACRECSVRARGAS